MVEWFELDRKSLPRFFDISMPRISILLEAASAVDYLLLHACAFPKCHGDFPPGITV